MSMDLNKVFLVAKVAGEYVAVPAEKQEEGFPAMLRMNETGHVIWQGLAQGKTEAGIVEDLTAEYEVTPEKAAEKVHKFVSLMKKQNIL